MPIRITGLNSGLDTETLVTELVSAYSMKKDKYVKAQTKLSWKQNAWKSLNTKVKNFQSSITGLRFSSAYNLKTAKSSDSTKATVKADGKAPTGTQSLKIKQLAKTGYLTGAKISSAAGGKLNQSSTLSEMGFSGSGSIQVKVGTQIKDIDVSGTTSISDFVTSLQNAGVNASFDEANQRMFISAKESGKDGDFTLIGNDSKGSDALYCLGISAGSSAGSSAYASLAKYAVNSFTDNGGGVFTTTPSTTDASGKITYSESATRSYVSAVLNRAAEAEKENADLTSANEKIQGQLTYLRNYESSQSVLDNLSATDQARLKSVVDGQVYQSGSSTYYITATKTASGETYSAVDESGNTYTVDKDDKGHFSINGTQVMAADGNLVEAKRKELGIKAGLVKKNDDGSEQLDSSGNKIYDSTLMAEFAKSYKAADEYEKADTSDLAKINEIQQAHRDNKMQEKADELSAVCNANTATIVENRKFLSDHSDIYATNMNLSTATSDRIDAYVDEYVNKIANAVSNLNGTAGTRYNTDATRVDGQNAIVYLNDAEFESASNTMTINGLTITALGETGNNSISVGVEVDTQGIYDKVKDFLSQYNEIINEMTSLYNADSAKGYEPLTSEEKSKLSDKEVEEWEEKVKSALLRRDGNLNTIMSAMTSAMSRTYEGSDGKKYSFSSFGIQTLGILGAGKDGQNAYHIYGDPDDTITSGYTDKLMDMITNDPDAVVDFMKNVATGLDKAIGDQMKATTLRSSQTIYNDKEMLKEYSDYTNTIKKWDKKVTAIEDSYYKKFAAMEKVLATLQSNSSSLTSLLS